MSNRVRAKKHFGQHFLKDDYYVKEIVQSMTDDNLEVIEIGPGLGDLTKELLKKACVVAYEIDIEAIEFLKDLFKKELQKGSLELIEGDVLKLWNSKNLREKKYKIIANLPYNIGTEIILRALRDERCQELTVMVQKEVAEKFCAKTREKNFSSLAILTQSIADASILLYVPPQAFEPPPKVDSAVFTIVKNKPSIDEELSQFLRKCFTAPRKTLLKNLSSFFERATLETIFQELDLAKTTRPHELTTQEYHKLHHSLKI